MGRRALVLLVALLLAGVAAFAVFQFLNGIRNDVEANREKTPVFRATQFIPQGSDGSLALQSEWFAAGEENVEDLPDGAITTDQELQAIVGGRLAVGPIDRNQIISQSQWAQLTVNLKPLSELIPSGKQAMTISTDAVRGVNGFVRPGDLINLIITVDIEFNQIPVDSPIFGVPTDTTGTEGEAGADETTETVTYTRFVLQGLPVLAVARDVRAEEGEGTPIVVPEVDPTGAPIAAEEQVVETVFTLEVTPEQAERIAFSFDNGSVWMTLVPADFIEVDTDGVTIESLFAGDLLEDIFGN
ncbi:MAG TPA: Flp pilus assembly protein CpaB [Acidimicrobiia bacterium]|nr:Flp pilus assembly protein CpaB [Acidimicrobiia bacterium]